MKANKLVYNPVIKFGYRDLLCFELDKFYFIEVVPSHSSLSQGDFAQRTDTMSTRLNIPSIFFTFAREYFTSYVIHLTYNLSTYLKQHGLH